MNEYINERLDIINEQISVCSDEERLKVLERIKNDILKFKALRSDFKIVNSREVATIGYDAEKGICVIHYNHYNSGKTFYYYGATHEEFEQLKKSEHIAETAENIFKNKETRH